MNDLDDMKLFTYSQMIAKLDEIFELKARIAMLEFEKELARWESKEHDRRAELRQQETIRLERGLL